LLILIGWMRRATLLGAKFDECRACHQPGPHLLLRKTHWFTVFRIPIVFLWMSHGILCPECGDLEPVGFLAMRRAMKTGVMPLGRARPRFEAVVREQLGGTDPADWAAFGLQPDASPDDVRARWRELAKTLHPDRGGDPAAFVRMNATYQRLVASPDVRVSAVPDAREVFDPVVVNPKRGFFDVYLKAWPVMVGLLVVSSYFSHPSAATSAGSSPAGPGTTTSFITPRPVIGTAHTCWGLNNTVYGCRDDSTSAMLFGEATGQQVTCWFVEPWLDGQTASCK
jgi:hypothetical protein